MIETDYNVVKGRIAEVIVGRLFTRLGYIVKYNGIEYNDPNIAYKRRERKLDKGIVDQLAASPDLQLTRDNVCENGKHSVHLVEVKYRTNGKCSRAELLRYEKYQPAFILVDLDGIWCVSHAELFKDASKSVHFEDCCPVADHPLFDFSDEQKQLVDGYIELVRQTLGQLQPNAALHKAQIFTFPAGQDIYEDDSATADRG